MSFVPSISQMYKSKEKLLKSNLQYFEKCVTQSNSSLKKKLCWLLCTTFLNIFGCANVTNYSSTACNSRRNPQENASKVQYGVLRFNNYVFITHKSYLVTISLYLFNTDILPTFAIFAFINNYFYINEGKRNTLF